MKPLAEIGLALIMLGGCRMAEAPAAPQGFSEPAYTTAPVGTAPSASDPPGCNALPPAQPSGMARAATPPTGQPAPAGSSSTASKSISVPWIVPPPAAPITPPTRLPEALPQSAAVPTHLPGAPADGRTAATEAEQPPPPDWSFLKTTASESAKPHQASPSAGGISQAAAATDTMPAMAASPTRTVITRPGPAASDIRLVNSKRISLNYKVNNVGPSGVTAVELWCTRDGRTWKKLKTF